MKRKISDLDREESRLSSLLFNKTQKFAETLSNTNNTEHELDLKPAWIDEDDDQFGINIIPETKSKGLYVHKLKQKYETLIGTPSWAKVQNNATAEEDDDEEKILRTVGHLQKPKSTGLKKDVLEIKTFPKINSETGNEGPLISAIAFHPKMNVVLVAGQSGVVSIFSIGGDVNNKIHSFHLKKWKIASAQFTPDGSEAYITSKSNHSYCVYNLIKAEPKLIQLPKTVKKSKIFQLSPDGNFIATSDGFDEVYIICTKSKELLRSLKHNMNVESLVFSHDSKELYSYGIQGEVTVWDLSTYRSIKKFYDNGCVTASCITMSPCGQFLATGSGEGIVNIYKTKDITTREPLPLKTISNLTTKITNLCFNSTSEILSLSSCYFPNAMKFVHIPSYHVFHNFPKQNLENVETVRFSPNSGYMAIGNNKSCAYLYRLKHYKNY